MQVDFFHSSSAREQGQRLSSCEVQWDF